MNTQRPSTESVRSFYDSFLRSRMLSYRLYGSPRIDAAVRMILPYVKRDSGVLDIGCGIGIAAERMAARAARGFVWACDLSESNVRFARQTVGQTNIDFFVCDVLNQFSTLRERLTGPIDLIVLIDVIEHVPAEDHAGLFARLSELAADGTMVAVTYPTPGYQRYLQECLPDELQPIDEIVNPSHLISIVEQAGFHLQYFQTVGVDRTAQYVHAIFRFGERCDPIVHTTLARIRRAGHGLAVRYLLAPYRRRRYVTQVLGRDLEENHGA